MDLHINVSAPTTLCLTGDLDLYTVEEARKALRHHLADQPRLDLDLGGIGACDAAGLQVLLAARRSAAAAGRAFSIRVPSSAVETCGSLLGLSSDVFAPVTP